MAGMRARIRAILLERERKEAPAREANFQRSADWQWNPVRGLAQLALPPSAWQQCAHLRGDTRRMFDSSSSPSATLLNKRSRFSAARTSFHERQSLSVINSRLQLIEWPRGIAWSTENDQA